MPRQPLMEDVESSWRLRERGGEFVFFGSALCRVRESGLCEERWRVSVWCLVLSCATGWRGYGGRVHAERLSRELYREYYR